jgi:hypothetical protein
MVDREVLIVVAEGRKMEAERLPFSLYEQHQLLWVDQEAAVQSFVRWRAEDVDERGGYPQAQQDEPALQYEVLGVDHMREHRLCIRDILVLVLALLHELWRRWEYLVARETIHQFAQVVVQLPRVVVLVHEPIERALVALREKLFVHFVVHIALIVFQIQLCGLDAFKFHGHDAGMTIYYLFSLYRSVGN